MLLTLLKFLVLLELAGSIEEAADGSAGSTRAAGAKGVTCPDCVADGSTGVTAANTDSDLTAARDEVTGIESFLYGYIAGGYESGGLVSTIDRLTFSTSVTAAWTESTLSQAREGMGGVSDSAVI